ncbi:hypothetical protein WJX82_003051 [Trebouxia sp. C0006]
MKFSQALKANSVPDWKHHYIHYSRLKKMIFRLEQLQGNAPLSPVPEHRQSLDFTNPSAPLLSRQSSSMLPRTSSGIEHGQIDELMFEREIHDELARVKAFYVEKHDELDAEVLAVLTKVAAAERRGISGPGHQDVEGGQSLPEEQRIAFWNDVNVPRNIKERLSGALTDVYIQLDNLSKFVELNYDGFRKILKKHDKMTNTELSGRLMPTVSDMLAKEQRKGALEGVKNSVVHEYALIAHSGGEPEAEQELGRHRRDQLTFERNTVWRDMVAMQRRGTNVVIGGDRQKLGARELDLTSVVKRNKKQITAVLISLTAFAVLLNINIPIFKKPQEQNCAALLAFVSLLWCTEALPLYITSTLIPLLAVMLRVLTKQQDGHTVRLTPQEAAPQVFHAMFSQVIMLLLGGFAIAGALSKHFIAKSMATAILSRVGRQPHWVLLANMLVATFLSMFISNVAAPVLCFGLVQPILRTYAAGHPVSASLVMGIALASNVGGMTSPISSPQNIFAIERMVLIGSTPSWLQWFAIALPIGILVDILCWGLLLVVYRPGQEVQEIRPLKPNKDPWTATQLYVMFISVATVGLWCANTKLQTYTGEMGTLAILPLVAFFGTGVLGKDDWNGFLWDVVMLAMGGLALGECVKSSGLLSTIAGEIGNFVVGAMIILPIVQSVGEDMADPHPKLLVMGAALMCSGAMGLPVSGFPNMNAIALEDGTGSTYVTTKDFLKVGLLGSVFAFGVINTLGYFIMLALGF